MNPITSDRDGMRRDFESRLPAHLGAPYTMNTLESPTVFVAFFAAQRHEMTDGSVVHGNEIRLLEYGEDFRPKKMLAAIIGMREYPADFVVLSLKDQGTSSKDIRPYAQMIREMLSEAVGASPQRPARRKQKRGFA